MSVTPAADEAGTPEAPEIVAVPVEVVRGLSRGARQTVAIAIVAVIALVAALYLARAFFVPLLIGILASYVPARRASRVDPIESLRGD